MGKAIGVRIVSFGKAFPGDEGVPGRVLTNAVLSEELHARGEIIADEKGLTGEDRKDFFEGNKEKNIPGFDTSDEWIVERTGIRERREAAPEIATSDLAGIAAKNALEKAGVSEAEIGFIELATVSPDYLYSPPTVSLTAGNLGITHQSSGGLLRRFFGADISVACSSFIAAFQRGYALIASGLCRRGLVIGADTMTRTTNPNDRNFYPLLGDGAVAILIEACGEEESFFTPDSLCFGMQPEKWFRILAKYGGSKNPMTPEALLRCEHKLWMDGGQVFKEIVPLVFSTSDPGKHVIGRTLLQAGKKLEDIDVLFLHQANIRMIRAIQGPLVKSGFKGEVVNNIDRYGNTTSATIPSVMQEAYDAGILLPGKTFMSVAFGGGYTWGSILGTWK